MVSYAARLLAVRASADITAFLGVNPTPTNRPVKGFAVGAGLLIVGFEFEYARHERGRDELSPRCGRTCQRAGADASPIAGMQFYATAGGGVYRETLLGRLRDHVGINVGGGVKMSLAGPLRLRLDYRVFTLKGSRGIRSRSGSMRGLNLKF